MGLVFDFKKKEILTYVTVWMNLEDMCKWNKPSQEDKQAMVPFVGASSAVGPLEAESRW